MILLWGVPQDEPLSMVHAALRRKGATVMFLNHETLLGDEISLTVALELKGTLRSRSETVDIGEITAAYVRPYDTASPSQTGDAGDEARTQSIEDALLCWCELTPVLVVNRPTAMAANNSKPFQSQLIRKAGLPTPDTLVTTDPQAARAFWDEHGSVIYKSISGVRSIVSRLTNDHNRRLHDIEHCPTQFQEYVDGVDVRIHVVGDDVFACEIESPADDYRYAHRSGLPVEIRPCSLPDEVETACREIVRRLQLAVAGIDFRRTPDERWVCLEVNPSPGFSFYELAADQPISDAIAQLLITASPPPATRMA
jgi:glutathione synthase/RimK-type ligase-like ATP-grasp enzyme